MPYCVKVKNIYCLIKYFVIFLFLLIKITTPIQAINNFQEELNNGWSYPSEWNTFSNSGIIDFTDSYLTLSSIHKHNYPYIYSDSVFPLEGKFSIELSIKFNSNLYNYGAGLSISDNLPPFPTTTHPGKEHSIINIWPLGGSQFVIGSTLCPNNNPTCTEDYSFIHTFKNKEFYEWQKIKINYDNNQYKVFINNEEKFNSVTTSKRPQYIWMGNPITTVTNVIWPSFSLDYIYINSLTNSPIVFLPGFSGSFNLGALKTGSTLGPWTEWPLGISPYHNLENTLTSSEAGYTLDKDYFEFYYDWRQPIEQTADELNDYLENTVLQDKPDDTQINLVAHSMGGLLARAYAQKYGDEKIEKLITVGSPHRGALKTYYLWEAGEISDKPLSEMEAYQYLWLMINTIHNNIETPKHLVQQTMPAVKNMLPTFGFLKNPDNSLISIGSMAEQNDFLPNLTDSDSLKQKMINISAKENNVVWDTTEYYKVTEPNTFAKLLGYWLDGEPYEQEYTLNGDLTVLEKSALIPDVLDTASVITDHMGLLTTNSGIQSILDALELDNVNPVISEPWIGKIKPALMFLLGSPAEIKVATPENDQVGYGVTSPGLNTYYSPENKMIYIAPAAPGDYYVELAGTGEGVYQLHILQIDLEQNQVQTIKGKIAPDELVRFKLNFNPQSPQENMLIDDTNGLVLLTLTQQQLEELSDYSWEQMVHSNTKKKTHYYLQKILKYINKALVYLEQNNYYKASSYTLAALKLSLELQLNINIYFAKDWLTTENKVALKNGLDQVVELLAAAWTTLYQKAGKTIKLSQVERYQQSLERIRSGLATRVIDRANLGQDIDLGLVWLKSENKFNQAKELLTENKYVEAYINFFIDRFYLLETLKLL